MPSIDLVGSDSKRALLKFVKRRGEATLDDAVEATGLGRTTLREHLMGLERDGLVERRSKRQGRGRPSLQFRLTEAGEQLFPARDGVLLRELLGFLKREGRADLVESFFIQFWEARLREATDRMSGVDLDDHAGRLEVLRRILHEQGFMPEIEAGEDEVVIRECNCPFPEAVKQTRIPCRLEAKFFEQVLQHDARRVSYIPEGNAACTYTFAGNGDAAPAITSSRSS